jgi:hypothetical protein
MSFSLMVFLGAVPGRSSEARLSVTGLQETIDILSVVG